MAMEEIVIVSNIPEGLEAFANEQEAVEEELLARANVVGVAIGRRTVVEGGVERETDDDALTVLVDSKVESSMLPKGALIPKTTKELDTGVSDLLLDVQEVGVLQAGVGAPERTSTMLPPDQAAPVIPPPPMFENGNAVAELVEAPAVQELQPQLLRARMRPAMGGFSVAHYRVTAGTIATGCYDLTPFPSIPRRYYLLSNNHVLANSNNARIGDPILQPGPADGGSYPRDFIGKLARFVPIKFGGAVNYVDAAIAEVPFESLNRDIYWIGHAKRMYDAPRIGEIVQKTGRTTNFTTGRIRNINATVNVNYGGGRVAKFARTIVTTNMSAGGDSGSLVTDLDENGIGLLFAGSSQVTLLNHLNLVQGLLRVRITER